MTSETRLGPISKDDAPATHRQIGTAGWRKGSTGFAEINPGYGNPRLRQEWIITDWRNDNLNWRPFWKIK